MTPIQAYLAMGRFMDSFWEARKAEFDDDLPSLLGSMMLVDYASPIDKALWLDWMKCLPSSENITPEQGFAAMVGFWEKYISLGESETRDISRLLEEVTSAKEVYWQRWLQFVDEVLNKQH